MDIAWITGIRAASRAIMIGILNIYIVITTLHYKTSRTPSTVRDLHDDWMLDVDMFRLHCLLTVHSYYICL